MSKASRRKRAHRRAATKSSANGNTVKKEAAHNTAPESRPVIPQAVFDALEDDFFERAANLYTVEEVESFKDLDEGSRRAAKRR